MVDPNNVVLPSVVIGDDETSTNNAAVIVSEIDNHNIENKNNESDDYDDIIHENLRQQKVNNNNNLNNDQHHIVDDDDDDDDEPNNDTSTEKEERQEQSLEEKEEAIKCEIIGVVKKSKESTVGIGVGNKPDGTIVVSSINKSGLFYKTNLKVGMEIKSFTLISYPDNDDEEEKEDENVNNNSSERRSVLKCKGKSTKDIANFIRQAQKCKIELEVVSTTSHIVKHDDNRYKEEDRKIKFPVVLPPITIFLTEMLKELEEHFWSHAHKNLQQRINIDIDDAIMTANPSLEHLLFESQEMKTFTKQTSLDFHAESKEAPAASTSASNTTIKDKIRKAAVGVAGGAMVAVGIPLIPCPLPGGQLVVCGGIALLATEFEGAQRILDGARDKLVELLPADNNNNTNDDDKEEIVEEAQRGDNATTDKTSVQPLAIEREEEKEQQQQQQDDTAIVTDDEFSVNTDDCATVESSFLAEQQLQQLPSSPCKNIQGINTVTTTADYLPSSSSTTNPQQQQQQQQRQQQRQSPSSLSTMYNTGTASFKKGVTSVGRNVVLPILDSVCTERSNDTTIDNATTNRNALNDKTNTIIINNEWPKAQLTLQPIPILLTNISRQNEFLLENNSFCSCNNSNNNYDVGGGGGGGVCDDDDENDNTQSNKNNNDFVETAGNTDERRGIIISI